MEKDINNLKIITNDIKTRISFKFNRISISLLEILNNHITREKLYINLAKRDETFDYLSKRK
tara:strand:+ start:105 stop:290 length:186 start_codon:yes stop_codon:yes gene_type:complete